MASLEERACATLADVLGLEPSQVDMQSTRQSLEGWDSFGTVHLLVALEAEFGVTINPEEAVELRTTQAIVDLLRHKGA